MSSTGQEKTKKLPVVYIFYDFDGTLRPGSLRRSFLKYMHPDIPEEAFGVARDFFLSHKYGDVQATEMAMFTLGYRKKLAQTFAAQANDYFEGALEHFDLLRKHAEGKIDLRLHILSSANVDMLNATKVKYKVDDVHGVVVADRVDFLRGFAMSVMDRNEFMKSLNQNGVNGEILTRILRRLTTGEGMSDSGIVIRSLSAPEKGEYVEAAQKGVLYEYLKNPHAVSRHLPRKNLVIVIADGETDYEMFRKANCALGVRSPGALNRDPRGLVKSGYVKKQNLFDANYAPDSPLVGKLCRLIDHAARKFQKAEGLQRGYLPNLRGTIIRTPSLSIGRRCLGRTA